MHLTYKTHLNLEEWKNKFRSCGNGFKHLSFVHELGEENEDTPTPYEHTHIAVWFNKNLNTIDQALFDVGSIHPNWQPNKGLKWFKNLCIKYHKGFKTAADGKKFYKAPIYLYQEHCEEWQLNENWEEIIFAAPTVIAAAHELDIQAKTLAEIKAVKEGVYSKRYRAQVAVEEGLEHAWKDLPIPWDRKKKSLILRGKPEMGKTQWALAQFKKPYKISQLDQIRHIPDDCDGVVFDDMYSVLSKLSKTNMICVTTAFADCDVRLRHNNATMPAIPRIFTCQQYESPFGNLVDEGVERRLLVVECDEVFGDKMYQPSAAAVVAAP